MRLLVLSELFLPTKGGTAVWAAEVYRRLGGKEIHVLTADVPGAAEFDATYPNTIHRLKLERVPWLKPESLPMYARLFLRGFALALGHRFDAVHAFRALPEGLVAWLIARLSARPLVVYAHGEELTTWQGYKHAVMAFVLRRADRVIANSEFTRAELLRRGVPAQRIVVIYPGVDTARFRPGLPCEDLRRRIGLGAGQKLVLSVGRLSRRKGFDQVIRSLPRLLARGIDVHYVIVGIGEDRDYLDALARECGVAERVHFLGHVTSEDLPRWYNACDVFAMPNREVAGDTEGFGMVFIEAAACGKPAIAGRAGGTGAAVIDGVTGLRVDGAAQEAVAQGLERGLADERCLAAWGAAALARAREHFDWAIVAARTAALQRACPHDARERRGDA